ncbi:MAG: type VII toxin-antitoxin system HepT family RNase toxin [Candidatus Binatia bacterium]
MATIRRCLARIRHVTGGDPLRVREIDIQDIVVLNLQRAIQAAIDLAAHLISSGTYGLPDSLKAHFSILVREQVIAHELGQRLEAMVEFRNIAVHDYEALNVEILGRIVAERLPDLELFADAASRFLARRDAAPE